MGHQLKTLGQGFARPFKTLGQTPFFGNGLHCTIIAVLQRIHEAEAGMLEKMRTEMKARVNAGLIPDADKAATRYHLMATIKAGRTEIIVVGVNIETVKRMKMILQPLPDIAKHIRESIIPAHRTLTAELQMIETRSIALGTQTIVLRFG
jgi:predicted polyphosphate/ATP-dependent NAD kinase